MIPIPQNNQWKQTNSGEVFGNLFATKNLNFDQEGYLKLARRTTPVVYNVSNFTDLISILFLPLSGANGYYCMTSGRPFSFNLSITGAGTSLTTTDLNGAGSTGDITYDGVGWQGKWYVSQSTTFAHYNGSAWTTGLGSLTTALYHPLCVHEGLNYLAIGNGSNVVLYKTDHTLSTTLVLPTEYTVMWMVYRGGNLYIGTWNTNGGDAALFVWNGVGAAAQASYPVRGQQLFAGCIYQNAPTMMTSSGQLVRFNGGGFDVLANLPCYYTPYPWYAGSGYTRGKMMHRGMVADGEVLYLNLDGTMGDPTKNLTNQPSGLWVYDPKIGLYHKGGWSASSLQQVVYSSADSSTDIITVSASYTALTGSQIWAQSGTLPGGLVTKRMYYLIRVTSTTFKLATTYDNAIAGTAIDLTSNGSSGNFYLVNSFDYGNTNSSARAGAICLIADSDSNAVASGEMTGSQILFGAGTVRTNTSSVNTVQSLTPSENRGYFVTQKIFTNEVKDAWNSLILKYSYLFSGADKIIVKYRTSDKYKLPVHGRATDSATVATWASTTQFTTLADLGGVSVGDEVEITDGAGGGTIVHVSAISLSSGIYTVTVDEAVSGIAVSDLSSFIIQNWTKANTITGASTDLGYYKQALLDSHSPWIQFKIEIRGQSEPFINQLQLINNLGELAQ